ncbi:MAG: hypothetical protein WCT49_02930 [Candidatus Paceibacterota bacterium]
MCAITGTCGKVDYLREKIKLAQALEKQDEQRCELWRIMGEISKLAKTEQFDIIGHLMPHEISALWKSNCAG